MTVSSKSKIIITRAQEDSAEMCLQLEAQGLDVVTIPCLEFIDPEDEYQGLDSAIRANHEYDWVIFLSQKAAERFFDRLLAIGGHLFNLAPSLKIACIGDSTKRYVEEEIGFPVNFVPSQFNSDVFLEEFGVELNKEGKVYNKILLPRTAMVNDDFVASLDANVTLVHAYSTQCPRLTEEQKTHYREILNSDSLLKLTFTSSQIVRNFKTLVEEILEIDFASWRENNQKRLEIYSLGPKTSKTIGETVFAENLKLEIKEPRNSTIAELLGSLSLK